MIADNDPWLAHDIPFRRHHLEDRADKLLLYRAYLVAWKKARPTPAQLLLMDEARDRIDRMEKTVRLHFSPLVGGGRKAGIKGAVSRVRWARLPMWGGPSLCSGHALFAGARLTEPRAASPPGG